MRRHSTQVQNSDIAPAANGASIVGIPADGCDRFRCCLLICWVWQFQYTLHRGLEPKSYSLFGGLFRAPKVVPFFFFAKVRGKVGGQASRSVFQRRKLAFFDVERLSNCDIWAVGSSTLNLKSSMIRFREMLVNLACPDGQGNLNNLEEDCFVLFSWISFDPERNRYFVL